jgi:hypothetical protein
MKRLAGLIGVAALAVACGQTDAGITMAVKSKLAVDDTVKAYQVDVDTQNKVVTLRGEVDSEAAETMALQIARDTEGVRDVIDEIRVVPVASTSGFDIDDDLERDVKEAAEDVKDGTVRGANAVADASKRGANAVADAARKGADATVKGAKKVGSAVKDAVTDDDRDSDNDGK